jgi:hypothetical protein
MRLKLGWECLSSQHGNGRIISSLRAVEGRSQENSHLLFWNMAAGVFAVLAKSG